MQRRKEGFTLIELLVVIAIIAILAAILYPVFSSAREKALQSSCTSNVRNVVTAIQMYTQDYDERLVPWASGSGYAKPDMIWWYAMIFPYLRNEQVLCCPKDRRCRQHFAWICCWSTFPVTTSYGTNRFLTFRPKGSGWDGEPLGWCYDYWGCFGISTRPGEGWFLSRGIDGSLPASTEPVRSVLLVDSGWASFTEAGAFSLGGWQRWGHFAEHDPETGWPDIISPPIGFLDGHVKILRVRSRMGSGPYPGNAWCWDPDWGTTWKFY